MAASCALNVTGLLYREINQPACPGTTSGEELFARPHSTLVIQGLRSTDLTVREGLVHGFRSPGSMRLGWIRE